MTMKNSMKNKVVAIAIAAVLGLTSAAISLTKNSDNTKYGFEPSKAKVAKEDQSSTEVTTFFQELDQRTKLAGLICGQYDEVYNTQDYTFYDIYGRIIDKHIFQEGYVQGRDDVQKIRAIEASLPAGERDANLERTTKSKKEYLMQEWQTFTKKWGFEDIQNMDAMQTKSLLLGIACGQYDGMYFDYGIVPPTINEQYQANKDELDESLYKKGYNIGLTHIIENKSQLTQQNENQIKSELTIVGDIWNTPQSDTLTQEEQINFALGMAFGQYDSATNEPYNYTNSDFFQQNEYILYIDPYSAGYARGYTTMNNLKAVKAISDKDINDCKQAIQETVNCWELYKQNNKERIK